MVIIYMSKKIAFIGDSLFRGSRNIPTIVSNILKNKHKILNSSIYGLKITKNLLNEKNSWCNNNDIIKFKPNIIIIMLGTNNVNDNDFNVNTILKNYKYILKILTNINNPHIFICLPPPIYLYEFFKKFCNDDEKSMCQLYTKYFLKNKEFEKKNEIIKFLNIIEEFQSLKNMEFQNIEIIDVFNNSFQPNYYIDDIHLSYHGMDMIGCFIVDEIKKFFGQIYGNWNL